MKWTQTNQLTVKQTKRKADALRSCVSQNFCPRCLSCDLVIKTKSHQDKLRETQQTLFAFLRAHSEQCVMLFNELGAQKTSPSTAALPAPPLLLLLSTAPDLLRAALSEAQYFSRLDKQLTLMFLERRARVYCWRRQRNYLAATPLWEGLPGCFHLFFYDWNMNLQIAHLFVICWYSLKQIPLNFVWHPFLVFCFSLSRVDEMGGAALVSLLAT